MATVSGSDTGEGEFVMLKRKLATLYVLGNVFNVLTFIHFVFSNLGVPCSHLTLT